MLSDRQGGQSAYSEPDRHNAKGSKEELDGKGPPPLFQSIVA